MHQASTMRKETQRVTRSLIEPDAVLLFWGMDAIKSERAIVDELYLFSAVYSVVS